MREIDRDILDRLGEMQRLQLHGTRLWWTLYDAAATIRALRCLQSPVVPQSIEPANPDLCWATFLKAGAPPFVCGAHRDAEIHRHEDFVGRMCVEGHPPRRSCHPFQGPGEAGR